MARQGMRPDIHDFDDEYDRSIKRLDRPGLSPHNKELILHFRDACLLHQVCGKPRAMRIISALDTMGRKASKDFDQMNRQDIESLIVQLQARQPPYSPETLATMKKILRRFFSWILKPQEFPNITTMPPEIAWIKGHVRAKDKNRLERKDLITPGDVEKLLAACLSTRDKALIALLWETGARIGELGGLQLKNVTKVKHGYILDLKGKTGSRSPIVISAAPYLARWLESHPFKDDPEAPLLVFTQFTQKPCLLKYKSIMDLMRRLFKRAGLQKPFHPHIFRHSRATYVLANGLMNEQQAKAYFGWAPASDMLATYSHLIDQDANNAILKENNLSIAQVQKNDLKPMECRICGELNQPKTEYCVKCGAVLDMKKAYEHQTLHNLKDELFLNLFKILVEKGLVDEAAKEIHEAGLGQKLQRLAQHLSQEKQISEP